MGKSKIIVLVEGDKTYTKLIKHSLLDVISKQLEYLSEENKIFVLCTCAFYILDYNSNLIKTD